MIQMNEYSSNLAFYMCKKQLRFDAYMKDGISTLPQTWKLYLFR
jgi:hypothetical protein